MNKPKPLPRVKIEFFDVEKEPERYAEAIKRLVKYWCESEMEGKGRCEGAEALEELLERAIRGVGIKEN